MKRIKPQTLWKAARIMPWTILTTGIAALVCFRRYESVWRMEKEAAEGLFRLFRMFYIFTMWGGGAVVVAEMSVLLCGVILLICRHRCPRGERDGSDVLWRMVLLSPLFAVGTLLLMFLVLTFSYGMGV